MGEHSGQDLVGGSLGGYDLVEKIGEGGMGTVYRARDKGLDRFIAVKVLPAELAKDRIYRTRFLREARTLARIAHPNLIHIYTVGEEEGRYFFAMELIEGETLSGRIRRAHPLPFDEIVRIASQVMSALAKVHAAGVTHRDVKSANIMLTSDGRALLMDLGLARQESAGGLTSPGMVLGTPEYMSPEQAEGERAGAQSDIYSLGVVMYEMLAGKVPFTGKSVLAVLRRQVEEMPPGVRSVRADAPEALVRIVEKAMRKKAPERYQTVEEMARDLLKCGGVSGLAEVAKFRLSSAETLPAVEPEATPTIPSGAATIRGERPGFLVYFALAVGVLALLAALGLGAYFILKKPVPPPMNPFALIRVAGEEFPGRAVEGSLREHGGVWYVTVETALGEFREYPVEGMEIDYRAAREGEE